MFVADEIDTAQIPPHIMAAMRERMKMAQRMSRIKHKIVVMSGKGGGGKSTVAANPARAAPVVWRGPLKIKALKQMLSDVEWGDLDYLVLDLPPGTSDEPLSVAQEIPDADGAAVVATPQEVALLAART